MRAPKAHEKGLMWLLGYGAGRAFCRWHARRYAVVLVPEPEPVQEESVPHIFVDRGLYGAHNPGLN